MKTGMHEKPESVYINLITLTLVTPIKKLKTPFIPES